MRAPRVGHLLGHRTYGYDGHPDGQLASPPGLLRPEAGPAGFVPGVPPLQDVPGFFPRHELGEPVVSPRPRHLRLFGSAADLTFVRKKEDRRAGLVGRLPYVGPGWYGKPATSFMLDTGLAT